jgi:hypothetical protein
MPKAAEMKEVTRLAATSSPASRNGIAGGNRETSSFTNNQSLRQADDINTMKFSTAV